LYKLNTNEGTGLANTVQAKLDLPKYLGVLVLALVLFVSLLQFLPGRVIWLHGVSVSGAGRR